MSNAAPAPSSRRRATRQRAAVDAVLDTVDEFRSAQELHALLREDGDPVGLTTVYRTLATLAEEGHVDSILREDGEAAYRRCRDEAHHHHLVCRDCGRTVEVDGPAVERWAHRVAEQNGFSEVSHTVEIFGRCAACTGSSGR
jgi:Fur family ferric uptake transcriptional regulator